MTKNIQDQPAKKQKSPVWDTFEKIFDEENKQIEHFYYCSKCKIVINVNITKNGTNALRRHKCVLFENRTSNQQLITSFRTPKQIDPRDKKKLKHASYNYIVQDTRPMSSIEGIGLIGLMVECTGIGAKYVKMTNNEMSEALPTEKTVSS